jgi:hypothetical protein
LSIAFRQARVCPICSAYRFLESTEAVVLVAGFAACFAFPVTAGTAMAKKVQPPMLMDTETKTLLKQIPKTRTSPKNGSALTYTNFTRKDLMTKKDGKIWGNWNTSFGAACLNPMTNKYIEEGAVIQLKDVGKCSGSGYTIIMCESY